jgi:hypothetical protein
MVRDCCPQASASFCDQTLRRVPESQPIGPGPSVNQAMKFGHFADPKRVIRPSFRSLSCGNDRVATGTQLQPNWDIRFPVATGSAMSGVPSEVDRVAGKKLRVESRLAAFGLMSRFLE